TSPTSPRTGARSGVHQPGQRGPELRTATAEIVAAHPDELPSESLDSGLASLVRRSLPRAVMPFAVVLEPDPPLRPAKVDPGHESSPAIVDLDLPLWRREAPPYETAGEAHLSGAGGARPWRPDLEGWLEVDQAIA